MYKLLYVLTSTNKDLYCEQCILSIMSAKKNSPNTPISLLIDNSSKEIINANKNRCIIFSLVDEVVSVPKPEGLSEMETSRYLKTTMRKFIKGDFLYIDSDTIVCESLDEIEKNHFDLGAVLDQHMFLSQSTHASVFRQNIIKVSGINELANCEYYFNGGVLWVRDTIENHSFFEEWNKNWLHSRALGIKTDMPALMTTNYQNKNIINELDGKWNCQVWFAANYLSKAKIIHYFASNSDFTGGYNQFNKTLPQKIKQGQQLNEFDWDIIQNARNAFPSPNAIITGADYEIYRSSLCGVLRALYRRKKIFDFMEKLLYSIRIIRAKIMLKKK